MIEVTDSVLNIPTPKESLPALEVLKKMGSLQIFEDTSYKYVLAQLTCDGVRMFLMCKHWRMCLL